MSLNQIRGREAGGVQSDCREKRGLGQDGERGLFMSLCSTSEERYGDVYTAGAWKRALFRPGKADGRNRRETR